MTVRFGSMAGATAGAGARAQGCLRGGTHAGATPAGPGTGVSHRVGRTAAAGELTGCGPRWWPVLLLLQLAPAAAGATSTPSS
jgi:hypothetical protein